MRAYSFPALVLLAALAAFLAQPALADFSSAKLEGPVCPVGSIGDPRGGGECWSCPVGTRRTVFAVHGPDACEKPASSAFTGAEWKRKNTRIGQGCPAGQFWDLVGGDFALGACYACPAGYVPTAAHVASGTKCEKVTPVSRFAATFQGKQGVCAAGQFLDPRNGGECWSCPASTPFRTVNAVNGPNACAGKFAEIFAADTGAICRDIIGAVRAGADGGNKLAADLEKLIAPVMGPVQKELEKVSRQIRAPAELDKLFDDISAAMQPVQPALVEITRFAEQALRNPVTLDSIVLDPGLVCGGDRRAIEQALARAGVDQNFSFGAASGGGRAFHVISLGAMVRPGANVPAGFAASFSILTDFRGTFRTLVSVGGAISTSARFEPSISYVIFPSSQVESFEGIGNLGTEFSIGPGDALDRLMSRNKRVASGPGGGSASAAGRAGSQYDKLPLKPKGQYQAPPKTQGYGEVPKAPAYDTPHAPRYGKPPQTEGYAQRPQGQYQELPLKPKAQYDQPSDIGPRGQYQELPLKPKGQYDQPSDIGPRGQYQAPPKTQGYGEVPKPPAYDTPQGPPTAPGYGVAPRRPDYNPPPQAPRYGKPPQTEHYGQEPPPFGGVAGRPYQAPPQTQGYGQRPQGQYQELPVKPKGQYDDLSDLGPKGQYQAPPQTQGYAQRPQGQYQAPPVTKGYGGAQLPSTPPPRLAADGQRRLGSAVPAMLAPPQAAGPSEDWFPGVCSQLGWCQGAPVDAPAPTASASAAPSSGGSALPAGWPDGVSIVISVDPAFMAGQKVEHPGIGLSWGLGKAKRPKLPIDVGVSGDITFRVGAQ